MSPTLNENSIDVLCKLLMDAIQVNPEAKPVVMSLIDTLLDNNVRQDQWGTILFSVWQELQNSQGTERL
jgi:hypothetical protein